MPRFLAGTRKRAAPPTTFPRLAGRLFSKQPTSSMCKPSFGCPPLAKGLSIGLADEIEASGDGQYPPSLFGTLAMGALIPCAGGNVGSTPHQHFGEATAQTPNGDRDVHLIGEPVGDGLLAGASARTRHARNFSTTGEGVKRLTGVAREPSGTPRHSALAAEKADDNRRHIHDGTRG